MEPAEPKVDAIIAPDEKKPDDDRHAKEESLVHKVNY